MIDALALLALALQAAPPARTVNDAELGPAEAFTTHGPATVCLRELVVRAGEGESVQLSYSGIHYASLILTRRGGDTLELTEGESFKNRRERRQRTEWRQTGMALYRVDRLGEVEYQLEGEAISGRWGSAPRAFVKGKGLRGDPTDRQRVKGVSFEPADAVHCDRRYDYGWDVLLGDAPLDAGTRPTDEDKEK
ncbi:hypothetical protein ACLBKU_13530 [Erythrobacter sp. NE805]|uniref:hypothetical protein n=1 Tax=Erythrobacter sp. NE805 TaxID=3389875 RepID=UPI00396B4075